MNVLRAELRKLLTLPSLWLAAALTWSANALLTWLYVAADARGEPLGGDAAVAPLGYAQAGFVVLGVLAAASEHQGGEQIRTTLLAVPRRLPLQAAKVLTLTAVTLPLAAATAATGAAWAGDASRLPAAVAYLTLTTLLAAAAGGCLRRAEPALVLLLTAYFVAGPLLRAWDGDVAGYLPGTAALDPTGGIAATVVWTAAAVTLAAAVFRRRDA